MSDPALSPSHLDPRSSWANAIHRARALDGHLDALIAQSHCAIARPHFLPTQPEQRHDTAILDPALWPAFDFAARKLVGVRELVRPADWRRAFYASTARWLEYQAAAEELALRLTVRGVRWLPIKGLDVATRFYPERELRTLADIDILISHEDLDAARRTLEAGGFCPVYSGARSEDYLQREGYCWPMVSPSGVLVELHTRFWGLIPSGFEHQVLETAVRLKQTGNELRPSASNAWVLAAVHSWFESRPRTIKGFRDLEWIARSLQAAEQPQAADLFLDQVVDTLCAWDLQLLGALSAITCHRLFANQLHDQLAARLEPQLRSSEARVVARLRNRGPDELAFSRIARARLLARRRSRAGYRTLYRQLWAHPAVVERETDDNNPFWLRRLAHMTRRFRRPQPMPHQPTGRTTRSSGGQVQVLGGESTH
jgi:hypothetical protein